MATSIDLWSYDDPSLPPPLDMSHHLSYPTRARIASNIKAFYKYFAIPGILQVAGGLPNPDYFPFDDLEAKVALPDRFEPTPNEPPPPRPAPSTQQDGGARRKHGDDDDGNDPPLPPRHPPAPLPPSARLVVPHRLDPHTTPPSALVDVASALQYGTAQGYPALHGWIRAFARDHLHRRVPYRGGPEVVLTCGNTDGLSKTFEALSNVWREPLDPVSQREGLIVEEFCYMAAVGMARPRGLNVVPVGMDAEGMLPGALERVLRDWDEARGRRPHLMYTVSVGQNPTGGTLSVERKRQIYEICCRYDVVIIEDEPYWYLQYPSSPAFRAPPPPETPGDPFLDSLVPSYLALDVQGRVVRLDTFSKTVAPGCRLGWITAQPALVERLLRVTEATTQQPSGFVRSAVAELILGPAHRHNHKFSGPTPSSPSSSVSSSSSSWFGFSTAATKERPEPPSEQWDFAGFTRWLAGLRGAYERRVTALVAALEEGDTWLPPAVHRINLPSSSSSSSVITTTTKAKMKTNPRTEEIPDCGDEGYVHLSAPIKMYSFTPPSAGMFLWLRVHFSLHPLAAHFPPPRLSRALWLFWTRPPCLALLCPGAIFAPDQEVRAEKGWAWFRVCFAAVEEREVGECGRRVAEATGRFWGLSRREVEAILRDDEDDGWEAQGGGVRDLAGFGGVQFC